MRAPAICMAGLLLLTPAIPWSQALAQDAERFRLEKTEGGYVRMDTRTGAMAFCRERSGELVCSAAEDERQAEAADMEALQERLAALEERVEALERAQGETSNLPTENEFEQALGLMERFFRRFMDIVKGLEEDPSGDPAGGTETPGRT